ncbi:hypothetical protein Cgig2_005769 [Carnegiea gigantea]|uniref:DUF4283 domain-containing protein n=1 Tax=Carnegiea gigantea TaxID=171969 RepID=A0A9Q1JK51_9CARY|nr:hypothetical protein Cgig2_005769 [Carnegiea gigantea]
MVDPDAGLELKYWGLESLSKLGSILGVPLKTDQHNKEKTYLQYARVLMDINLAREFPNYIEFLNDQDVLIRQRVTYEWKPTRCDHCQMYGHVVETCRKKTQPRFEWRPKRQEARTEPSATNKQKMTLRSKYGKKLKSRFSCSYVIQVQRRSPTKAFTTPAKRTYDATRHRLSKSDWFKEDIKEISKELTGLKAGHQAENKKTLVDLKRFYEDLTHCACELNNVISYLKVKEGSLKVNNDEFRANVARLEMTLKIA